MAEENAVVFLEDIETKTASRTSSASTANGSPSTGESKNKKQTTLTTGKRQRTLMDMFTPAPKKEGTEERSTKKVKLTASGSSSSIASTGNQVKVFGIQPLNSIPFSVSAYLDALNDEQKQLLKLEIECMNKTWLKVLKDEIKKPYFTTLKRLLWEEGVHGADDSPRPLKVFPPPRDIYSWSHTPLGRVKVVILGQDPYHGAGQAHGLCFSVPKGVRTPPSLKTIYTELAQEYGDEEFKAPNHGNLSAWADAGVLLLNASLTVRANAANSHSKLGWEIFTEKVIEAVDKYGGANLPDRETGKATGLGRGVVFLCWGRAASNRVARLNSTRHLILHSPHPSPLAAASGNNFVGNGHFKKANEWLEARYGPSGQVDWCSISATRGN